MTSRSKKLVYALLSSLVFTACTKTPADNPSAGSSVQMMELNKDLKSVYIDDAYRNTYEIFPYSYCDTNGDGIGDLKGIISKLDYIQDMGFTALWLTPVHPSGTYHKYDVDDYYAIDPQFGTMEDYETLIEECGKRNIRVIMDLVLNHTSTDNEWFQKAHEYLKELPPDWGPSVDYCKYFDYYNFTREAKEGWAPLSDTNWYYEARFWDGMPDLNLDSSFVRQEITDIMKFWLDKGVSGFRLDAVTSFYTGNPDQNTEFLRWLVSTGKSLKKDCYFVGEAWTGRDEIAKYYESGIDSLFNFPFADQSGILCNVMRGSFGAEDYVNAQIKADQVYRERNSSYVDAPFYTNHDMGRSAGYYALDEGPVTKMAYALSILMSGNTYVYYGEELGMKGSGRDENKRAPMYWSTDASSEGMCRGPEGMDEIKMKFPSFEEQKTDDLSMWNYFRQALKIRNAFPSIARGEITLYDECSDEELAVFAKDDGVHEPVLLVINVTDQTETADLSSLGEFTKLSAVLNTSEEKIVYDHGNMTMPPFSIAVLTGE